MNETAAPGKVGVKADATMDVEANVYPVEQGKGNLLAFASVTLGGCFAIHDLRVMDGKNGPFVAMPSKMGKDKQYHDTCFHSADAAGPQRRCHGQIPVGRTARAQGQRR